MRADDCPEGPRKTLPEILDVIRRSGQLSPEELREVLCRDLGLGPDETAELLRTLLAETP